MKAAAYTFGPARFRIRGYESNHTAVTINGFIANDLEFGAPYWSDWGGLNDVMRNTVITNDSRPSGYMFDPLGGSTNIITKPSEYRSGTKLTYPNSNRTYGNRAMVTHSTGMMENGWAVTVYRAAGARRVMWKALFTMPTPCSWLLKNVSTPATP